MKAKGIKAAAALILLISILLTTACGGRQEASFIIAGSTSVQPYVEILAEEYALLYPEKLIDIQGGGSSAGITAVESETAHLGMSSRNLKESEQHLWSVEITKDGLAIIVNPGNPIGNLTIAQLRGIYTADIVNWSELGGSDAKIHIITREEGSGTRSAFEEMVMGGYRITPRAIVQDSNGAVRQLVADDPHSIGFISLGLVDVGERPVKAMNIEGAAPTRENVLNGSYTLFRSFLFVAKSKPTGYVMQFIDFVRSPEGQRVLSDEGLIPE
jgi:phosphate transport system substrate-binding protein